MVAAAQAAVEEPGLKMVPLDRLHITLAFLGEVGSEAAEAARLVVSEREGSIGGTVDLGGFVLLPGPTKARVVALGVEDAEGVLSGLHRVIEAGLVDAGAMEPERRPFRPHLTIARSRRGGRVHPKSDSPRGRLPVRSVCLYQSRLTREGARYEVLTEAILRDR